MLNKTEFYNHLTNDLLPFWNNLYDSEYGGFYGSVNSGNIINKTAPKSAVLQTRLLWYYSSCYKELQDIKLLEYAHRQFEFISTYMIDPADGGIYWEVEHDGKIKDSRKHTYALAFTLYAFSAYYDASKNKTAFDAANRLFNLTETNFKDEYGYLEDFVFDKADAGTIRTMNTLLHIIEAYTEYYRVIKSENGRKALEYSINLVINKAYNDNLHRIDCYFDKFMNPVGDILSYGHDIESSWLIYRACEVLGNKEITGNLSPKLEKVAQNVISKGFVDESRNGMYYDCKNGVENKTRSWWVMAEAIVALVHQYNLYGDSKSMILAENMWNYVKKYFISPYGEWHMQVNDNGEFMKSPSGLCGAWKCPYHNGRMCLEMMKILP
ncbi:MAG: AGE family epimerase/isomerase [Oscillospiraceae bacterium]|nr:AGE family epimerase/isomerase [Oscillospiraceae bacterium]